MLQLLSSLWVTRAVGTFARLGLADVMEDGADDHRRDCRRARPRPRPRLSVAARALHRWHRDRARARTLRAHSARTPAQLALRPTTPGRRRSSSTTISPTCGCISMMRSPANAPPSRRSRAGRSSTGCRESGRSEAVQPHDARGARTGDAGDRRRLRLLYFDHIVDVGGGNGALLSAVLAAYPNRRGTLFDLAEAIAAAKRGEGGPLPGVDLRRRRRVRHAGAGRGRPLSDPPPHARL